ncbi:MAG TPA: hypothetical protein VMU82_18060 [Acetobacteraceae bacterium]|nr:hypothetical protein [Acetobacteraceae bacterium]
MPLNARSSLVLAAALLGTAAFPALSPAQAAAPLAARQVPLPPIPHPPGDIPDTQVFIDYHAPWGFSIKVPEGWARRVAAHHVAFTSAYDGLAVRMGTAATAPSVAGVKQDQAALLARSPMAVRISKIAAMSLPGGPAVLIAYSSNSAPNAVTGKAIRLENDRYLFWKGGKLATLTLSAPFGADNVDQWRLIARSFRWN